MTPDDYSAYIRAWLDSDCSIEVTPHDEGVRVHWSVDDPLDFVILPPKQVVQFIDKLNAALAEHRSKAMPI